MLLNKEALGYTRTCTVRAAWKYTQYFLTNKQINWKKREKGKKNNLPGNCISREEKRSGEFLLKTANKSHYLYPTYNSGKLIL